MMDGNASELKLARIKVQGGSGWARGHDREKMGLQMDATDSAVHQTYQNPA